MYTAASIATAGPEISQSDATQTANETESILRNLSINIKIQIPCGRLSLTQVGFGVHVKITSRIVSYL